MRLRLSCLPAFRGSLLLALACVARVAAAQPSLASEATFSPQLFHPAPGPTEFMTIEAARPLLHLQVAAGVSFDYARNPLAILTYSSRTQDPYGVKVFAQAHAISGEAWVALGLFDRAQLALSLPALLYGSGQSFDGDQPPPDGVHVRPPSGAALGDPRLHLKVRLYGKPRGFQVALSHWLSAPLGTANRFGGEPHWTGFAGEPRLLLEWIGSGRIRAGLSVGFHWRARPSTYYSAGANQAITYGAAVAVEVVLQRLQLIAELYGHHDFGARMDYTAASPLELDVAGRVQLGRGVALTVGVGVGVLEGVGAPRPRAFLALQYERPLRDRDRDGIPDWLDRCPDVAEDRDGFQDEDGCPEIDNDGDGIRDENDRCPNAAEDFDDFQDADGCPELDNDGDGLDDKHDGCPLDAEDKQPPMPHDGCPLSKTDTDGDGISDAVDKCPRDVEDKDGFQDADGCPDPDNDDDGIPDEYDECPGAAEDLDQVSDEDGCPDLAGKVKLLRDGLHVGETIAVEGNQITPRGLEILDVIAKLLVGKTAMAGSSVRLEGYWDKPDKQALALSQALAETARQRLIAKGVPAAQTSVLGYGVVGKSGKQRVAVHVTVPPPPVAVPDENETKKEQP